MKKAKTKPREQDPVSFGELDEGEWYEVLKVSNTYATTSKKKHSLFRFKMLTS